jgi:hypothetical protein
VVRSHVTVVWPKPQYPISKYLSNEAWTLYHRFTLYGSASKIYITMEYFPFSTRNNPLKNLVFFKYFITFHLGLLFYREDSSAGILYNNIWGLGIEYEWGCRTGPPGYIGCGIDSLSSIPRLLKSLKLRDQMFFIRDLPTKSMTIFFASFSLKL